MPTHEVPKHRREYSTGIDGWPTISKHADESWRHTIDWSDELASGETISTSTWESGGVTLSAAGTTSTTSYVTVTGTGYAKNTVVTTGVTPARTLVRFANFAGVQDSAPAYT